MPRPFIIKPPNLKGSAPGYPRGWPPLKGQRRFARQKIELDVGEPVLYNIGYGYTYNVSQYTLKQGTSNVGVVLADYNHSDNKKIGTATYFFQKLEVTSFPFKNAKGKLVTRPAEKLSGLITVDISSDDIVIDSQGHAQDKSTVVRRIVGNGGQFLNAHGYLITTPAKPAGENPDAAPATPAKATLYLTRIYPNKYYTVRNEK
jgi:hypothetical protein